jgi:protein-S-isoprenylcysteine O-methyltransferase Ste14
MTAGARVARIPPPLYYGLAFAAGMVLRHEVPWPIGIDLVIPGAIILAAGLALAAAGIAGVVRHHTTMVPHHEVSALVTTGVYRWSRNPMYTGLALQYVGGSLLAGSWWPLILWPLVVLVIRFAVIGPEERYLATRFGADYASYCSRVRRWL